MIANVAFRQLMASYGERYPAYSFERHAAHPSPQHVVAFVRFGPSPIHHRHHRLIRVAGREAEDTTPDAPRPDGMRT